MLTDLTPDDAQSLSAAVMLAIGALFSLILVFGLRLARKATKQFEVATGIKLTEAQHRTIDDVVTKGIHLAQEHARKVARGLLTSASVTPQDKLEIAKSAARSLAPKALAEVSEDQLEILIEAKLASMRPPPDPSARRLQPSSPAPRHSIPPPGAIPYYEHGHAPFSPSAATPVPGRSRRPQDV